MSASARNTTSFFTESLKEAHGEMDAPSTPTAPAGEVRGPERVAKPRVQRYQPVQVYGFVDEDLRKEFGKIVKERNVSQGNVFAEGVRCWVLRNNWGATIDEAIYNHKRDIIIKGIKAGSVYTKRVGGDLEPDLGAKMYALFDETGEKMQNVIYVIVDRFVNDDTFREAIIDAIIRRKLEKVRQPMG